MLHVMYGVYLRVKLKSEEEKDKRERKENGVFDGEIVVLAE